MSLPFWIVGLFLIAIGLTEAVRGNRGRKIVEYESAICEPFKRHLDDDGCADCMCSPHGYGSICELAECRRTRRRPVEERECTPNGEFTTACHFCRCSAAGIPIDCVEHRRRCMEDIIDDISSDKYYDVANILKA